jgi:type IV secretory pathway VirJ component
MLTLYSQEWGKNRYIIIGYSLGAEIVPFIENRLPGELKSNIASTVLLSPGISTDFEIHISNMLGIGNHHNTYNVVDEISKTRSIPTLMIFGEGEDTKIPELLSGTGVRVKKIPGDHHYKSNSRLIVETMRSNHVF